MSGFGLMKYQTCPKDKKTIDNQFNAMYVYPSLQLYTVSSVLVAASACVRVKCPPASMLTIVTWHWMRRKQKERNTKTRGKSNNRQSKNTHRHRHWCAASEWTITTAYSASEKILRLLTTFMWRSTKLYLFWANRKISFKGEFNPCGLNY